jgi:hypothetical protein
MLDAGLIDLVPTGPAHPDRAGQGGESAVSGELGLGRDEVGEDPGDEVHRCRSAGHRRCGGCRVEAAASARRLADRACAWGCDLFAGHAESPLSGVPESGLEATASSVLGIGAGVASFLAWSISTTLMRSWRAP